jgi:hypothetical protein
VRAEDGVAGIWFFSLDAANALAQLLTSADSTRSSKAAHAEWLEALLWEQRL